MKEIKIRLTNKEGKLLQEYSIDGPLSAAAVISSAQERINKNPESFNNMMVCVEATDGKEILNTRIENIKWWTPKPKQNGKVVSLIVNGDTKNKTELKLPPEIVNSPNFVEDAMGFAKNYIKGAFEKNFPKGTRISIQVKETMGNGGEMIHYDSFTTGMEQDFIAGE